MSYLLHDTQDTAVSIDALDLVKTGVLLVALDFDGTLAPFAAVPDDAKIAVEALEALNLLLALPRTHAAIVSGRSLQDLQERFGGVGGLRLVGSHGLEFEGVTAPEEDQALLAEALRLLIPLEAMYPGVLIEKKPFSLSFHYRRLPDALGAAIIEDVRQSIEGLRSLHCIYSRKTIEISPFILGKGAAVRQLRREFGATGVLYIGDDVTDEDAFRSLCAVDMGVKVGPGETAATFRLPGCRDVPVFLRTIAAERAKTSAEK